MVASSTLYLARIHVYYMNGHFDAVANGPMNSIYTKLMYK